MAMLASSTLISQSKSIKENESLCYYYNCQIHFLLTKMKKKQMKLLLSTLPFPRGLPIQAYSLNVSFSLCLSFSFFFLSVFVLLSLLCFLFQSPSPHFWPPLSLALPPSPLNNLDFTVYLPAAKYRFIQACPYAKQRVWTLDWYLRHWSLVFACNNYSGTIMASSILYTHAVFSFPLFLTFRALLTHPKWLRERKKEGEERWTMKQGGEVQPSFLLCGQINHVRSVKVWVCHRDCCELCVGECVWIKYCTSGVCVYVCVISLCCC